MNVAVFSAKPYDRASFDTVNAAAGHPHAFTYFEAGLDPATAALAAGSPAACVFVNDRLDAATLEALSAARVRLIALRCAGFDPRRGVTVDEFLQTSAPGVAAIGDVNGLSTLADSALAQASVAVENALGARVAFDPARTPRCVHTDPAVAEVGLGEIAARAAGTGVCVGRGRFGEVTPVLNQGEGAGGWVKFIADANTRRLLGAGVVGERAAEWIGEFSLALSLGASVDALVAAPRARQLCRRPGSLRAGDVRRGYRRTERC